MNNWLKRILIAVPSLLIALSAIGFGYEQIMRTRALDRYPALGKLVDIGGRKMQIDCRGTGSPTIVLENGFEYFGSLIWSKIHDDLAKITRTCAYSRAGIMWSAPSPDPFTLENIASDLHKLLEKAGEKAPLVLVGHSFGGPINMAYTHQYGADVKGLVEIDTSHPDEVEKGKKVSQKHEKYFPPEPTSAEPPAWLFKLLADVGVIRIMDDIDLADNMKAEDIAAVKALVPPTMPTLLEQSITVFDLIKASGVNRQLGDRPAVFLYSAKEITATEAEFAQHGLTRAIWEAFWADSKALKQELADERATWSTDSRTLFVFNAQHFIHLDNPAVVIKAITDVVSAVRTGKRLNDTDTDIMKLGNVQSFLVKK
jgi:pimeloyl-ACP methyl ester carboxylesterase